MISRFNNVTQAQTLQPKKNNQTIKNQNPNFGNALATTALNSLNANPAIGACFLDLVSMVFPRTAIDSTRGFDAGFETGVRETAGTLNHGLAGVIGLGAGWLVSYAFNKANGVKTHFLFTDDKAIDVFSDFINANKAENTINGEKYFYEMFKNMKFLNTTTPEYKELVKENPEAAAKIAYTQMKDETAKSAAKLLSSVETNEYKTPKSILQELKALIIGEKGAAESVRLTDSKGRMIEDTLENHINNGFSVRRAFLDKFKADLKKSQKGKTEAILSDAEFISKIKGLKKYTAAAGLAVPVIIGMSTQPINRYLTKKRTGSDGFVGVEGREPDKSTKFKIERTVLGVALGSAMIATILKNPLELYKKSTFKKALKEIGSALQYKGLVPTMDQFKFIYGMTIMSRLFAVRDKNEMRESTIKDTLGFANWLILGGFVSKIVAKLFNKDTLNYIKPTEQSQKGFWNKIKNSYILTATEKSHEEILYPALKKLGINIKDEAGNVLPFKKLIKALKEQKANPIAQKALEQIKVKNYQQLAGYLYSGIVLGIGITELNIIITKLCEKNKKQPEAKQNVDKMKVSNEFIKRSAQNDSKTFGAFLKSI